MSIASVSAGAGTGAEVVMITGMSGAGRSTAAKVLEDLGWYVVDNLPPQMLGPLVGLAARAADAIPKLAVVLDIRGRSFFPDLRQAITDVTHGGIRFRIIFLDAADEVLVRRYDSVRRPHPLQGDGTILDGIHRERTMLAEMRETAETVIDTTSLNVHQLTARMTEVFGDADRPSLFVTVMSFGFKYGLPLDADNVVDVRFLPNPYWIPELRPYNGTDAPVRDYVLGQAGAEPFIDKYVAALRVAMVGYQQENKPYVTIAIGCTGGKHRSVAIAERIAQMISGQGTAVHVTHRDLGRE